MIGRGVIHSFRAILPKAFGSRTVTKCSEYEELYRFALSSPFAVRCLPLARKRTVDK